MASNRSQGGQSEYARKAAEGETVNLSDLDSTVKVDVCRLLTALMNATVKQLNCPTNKSGSLEKSDVEIAECVAGIALQYKSHLDLEDALQVAIVTSDDVLQLSSIICPIEDSRRLDSILSKANELLDHDDITFTRTEQEIWLGRRLRHDTPYFLSARVTVYEWFDAAPPKQRV